MRGGGAKRRRGGCHSSRRLSPSRPSVGFVATSPRAGIAEVDHRHCLGPQPDPGPLALVVGRELFDAARLTIDIDAATLGVAAMPPPGRRLALTARRGIEQVPVMVEAQAATADFDLGNGGTVLIGSAFAARHGLLDGRPTAIIAGGGIGGATTQTSFVLRRLDVAGIAFTDVPAAIDASPTASDANLGVRLLRRFGIVTDFAARSVWLDYRG